MDGKEYVSLTEYCKRFQMKPNSVKQLIAKGEIEAIQLESGYYKIKLGSKDTVPRAKYDKLLEEKIELETILNSILAILDRR